MPIQGRLHLRKGFDVGCQCPECGGQLTHIGDDVAEVLDVLPVRFRVIKTIRPKYSCRTSETLCQAAAPERVVPKGLASANLLTKVLVDKYLDHQPLYRQVDIMKREGVLQADVFAGYNGVYTGKVIAAGCWAHVRQKFYGLTQSGPAPLGDEALRQIQALYVIEDKIRGLPPDKRKRQRQLHAKPLLETLHDWMNRTLRALSKGSPLSKAIQYALKQWDALVVYVNHGQVEIDNNTAERSLRPIALGRKNYLFVGSVAGGERAAVIYTLLGTAKLNSLNPTEYLSCVLRRIGTHLINRLAELLPWNIDLTPTSGEAL